MARVEVMNGQYTGVLLAAGKGSRMAEFSDSYPKPILPIANKPLLVHQIELLASIGITDIVVLIGHKGYRITHLLGDGSQFGVQLRYVEQTEMLGIAHAVGQLESAVSRPFLMFLGDIYFVPRDIESMFRVFEDEKCSAVLATKEEPDPAAIRRNYSVILNDAGRVSRVIEKPRHIINNLKGVGLYLFDLNIFDAIRRTPRTAMRDEYEITEAIQVLINDDVVVRSVNAVYDDINVTFPSDLLKINIQMANSEPGGNIIHPTAKIHENASIRNSVIGAHAEIPHARSISNCVLFADSSYTDTGTLTHSIVTPERVIQCQIDN